MKSELWGTAPDGRPVTLYHLRSPGGLQASICDYGAVVVRLLVPDRHGKLADVVLGHDTPEPYFQRETSPFFGAVVGRYANRIAGGRFTLQGRAHQLTRNDGENTLHGGAFGLDRRLWQARPVDGPDGPALELSYVSPDGEEGFPGSLDIRVTYTLTEGALRVEYAAATDAPTVVNLTQHTYWNLSGDPSRDVLDHELTVRADHITSVGADLIPTGTFMPVEGTPFDFRKARPIGEHVDDDHEQLRLAGGYDHNFVLRGGDAPAAVLYHPGTGRRMEVRTTEPGAQVYSGNFLDGTIRGKGGQTYGRRSAVCLETQHFPDSPNQPAFPSTVLMPGERFSSSTVFAFSAVPHQRG